MQVNSAAQILTPTEAFPFDGIRMPFSSANSIKTLCNFLDLENRARSLKCFLDGEFSRLSGTKCYEGL